MIKYILPLLFLVSQLDAQISGNLLNDQQEPLEFANIILLNIDSQFVDAAVTDSDGFYEIKPPSNDTFYLLASMIGYDDLKSASIPYVGEPISVSLQFSDAVTLAEVEVKAKAPLIEQQAGKMVVNVAQNAANISGNIQELLRKVPGVIVVNNNVSLAGGRPVRILIDGRTTEYMDIESVLKDLPATDIEKIEVISQPGAEMDASGTGGVINIILKKNKLQGWNASITLGYGVAVGERKKVSTKLNYRKSKFNLYGGATWQDNFYFSDNSIDRTLENEIYEQYSTTPWAPVTLSGNIGLDYNLSKNHTLGVSSNLRDSENIRQNLSETNILERSSMNRIIRLITPVENEGDAFDQRYNAYYQWKMDTLGQQLDLDATYSKFDRDNTATFESFDENGVLIRDFVGRNNIENGETDLWIFAADYDKPITKNLKIESGAKASIAKLDNSLQSFLLEESPRLDQSVSDVFIFNEDIYAAYVKASFTKDKWDGNIGLRYEQSNSRGFSVSADSTLTREIGRLFPSGSLSYQLTKSLGTSASYSYRIERPNYNSLNSFIAYLDPLTSTRGNPFLTPEFTHSLQWSLTFDKQPFFNIEYNRTNNALVEVIEQNEATGEAYSTDVNLEQVIDFSTSLYFPLEFFEGLSGFGGVIYDYKEYDSPYRGRQFKRDAHNWTGFVQAAYNFKKDYKLNYYAWYTSGGIDGLFTNESMYGMGLGASADLLDGQLNVSVNWDDFINKFYSASIDYFDIQGNISSTWDRNIFRVQLTYKIGNRYLKRQNKRESRAAEELERAQDDR